MADIEILAFRADQKASKGITTAHVDDVIAGYNPALQVAPVVIGHPSNDAPAHGAITGLRREGNDLFVKFKDASAKLIDDVRNSRLVSRSIAFWAPNHPSNPTPGKYALRHFGFLGASAPGIPNLGKLTFSADDDAIDCEGDPAPAVVFAAAPTDVTIITDPPAKPKGNEEFSMKTEAELAAEAAENTRVAAENAAERTRLEGLATQFATEQTTRRHSANATSVDALITSGKVLPADKDALVKAFNAIPGDVVEFSADDKTDAVAKIVSIMSKGGKVVPVNEQQKSPTTEFNADDTGGNKAAADAALKAKNDGLKAAHTK